MSRSIIISNFLLFQLGWFACVLGGANQLGWLGSLLAISVITWHLLRAQQPTAEIRLLLIAFAIGLLFESLLSLTGISQYSSGLVVEGFPPHWMVLMWPLFATTLNVSMRWMKMLALPWVALLAGLLAPASYVAGQRLGAISFNDTLLALSVIALGWAILFPLLITSAKRYNGYPESQTTSALPLEN